MAPREFPQLGTQRKQQPILSQRGRRTFGFGAPTPTWSRNVQDADALISAYVNGGREQAEKVKVCTFNKNRAKALAVLESFDTLPDVLDILSGPKLREFAGCIAGLPDVCIDGHAYSCWHGERVTLANVPSIGKKLREQIKADYRAAAEELGETPAAVQACTWLVWRRLHLNYGLND